MKCVSCDCENLESAKFCRRCGAKLELSATVTQAASSVQCIACGFNNKALARFCAKCGTSMTGVASPLPVESRAVRTPTAPSLATPSSPPASAVSPQVPRGPEPAAARTAPATHYDRTAQQDIPALPQKIAPSRKGIYISIAIAVALVAIGGGSYFVIQQREEQKLALEKANEEKQRALAAAEQARKQAEEREAQLAQQKAEAEAKQKELDAQREAELRQREAEVRRQAADVQRRDAEAKRMEQEARDRQALAAAEARNRELARAQQEAIRRQSDELQRQRAAAAAQPPARTATRTAVELCANRRNFISRAICEGQECQKPEHREEARCRQIRESAERQRQSPN